MANYGIADKELSENLFTLSLQADAAFEQQVADSFQASNIQAIYDSSKIDHQELLVFLLWLARRISAEQPKVLNALQVGYFLVSNNSPFSGQDGQKVFQFISQRWFEYDQAMANAPQPLDVVYVSGELARKVFAHVPEVAMHMPRLELIVARLLTEWIVSVTKTIKELL